MHNQLDEFYRRIKLKARFHGNRKEAELSDKEYRFKSKSKHWVPTKTHDTIDTFTKVTKKKT